MYGKDSNLMPWALENNATKEEFWTYVYLVEAELIRLGKIVSLRLEDVVGKPA